MQLRTLALSLPVIAQCNSEPTYQEPIIPADQMVQDGSVDTVLEARGLAKRAMLLGEQGLTLSFEAGQGTSFLWDEKMCDDPNAGFNGIALKEIQFIPDTPGEEIVPGMKVGYIRECGPDTMFENSDHTHDIMNEGETADIYAELLEFHNRAVAALGYAPMSR